MTASPLSLRPLLIGALAVALLSQSGCAWTRSKLGMDAKYQDSVQNSPLEVPPGLDLPSTAGAVTVPDVTPNPNLAPLNTTAPASSVATTASGATVAGIASFTMDDTVDSAWRRLGLALGKIEGVSVDGSAQLLNSYEVNYQGAAMLIRAEAVGDQTRVVALGANGQPLTSGPGAQLLALLKQRLG
jgi:uncharacterized lipoprotein